jgi:hypothetical protein
MVVQVGIAIVKRWTTQNHARRPMAGDQLSRPILISSQPSKHVPDLALAAFIPTHLTLALWCRIQACLGRGVVGGKLQGCLVSGLRSHATGLSVLQASDIVSELGTGGEALVWKMNDVIHLFACETT